MPTVGPVINNIALTEEGGRRLKTFLANRARRLA